MDRARTFIGVATLIGLGGLALIGPRPVVDNRPAAWFPADDPRVVSWRRLADTFGSDDAVVVVVEGGDPLGLLRLAVEVSRDLQGRPGLERVTSAATAFPAEVDLLLDPALGGLANLRFVGHAFDGPLNRGLGLWRREPASAVLVVTVAGGPEAVEGLAGRLAEHRARAAREGRTLRAAGHPLINLELDRAGREVDARAMPVLVAVCLLVLVAVTRSPRLVVALLLPVGLAVVATDPLVAAAGASTNLIVAIVKPLVFVLLLAAGLHVAEAFDEARRAGASAALAAGRAVASKAVPTVLCLLTTAIGFGSLAGSEVRPVRTFGWATAAQVLLGIPLVLASVPLLLRLVAARGGPPREGADRLGPACVALVQHGQRRSGAWLIACALLCAAGLTVALRLRPSPHAIEYFPPGHPLRDDHDALARAGLPLVSIEAMVTLAAPVGSAAEGLDAFARAGQAVPGVRGCAGLPLLLREAVHRTARAEGLPAPWMVADILRRQAAASRPFLAEDGRTTRLSFAVDEVDAEELERIALGLRTAFAATRPDGAALELAGSYPLLIATQRTLLTTLRSSLLTTAALMLVVMAVAMRSLRLGLAAIPANAFPVAAGFVVMGGAGIALDVGTSMTAAISLGVAVDGTLHLLHAWRRGELETAARATGRAMVLAALVVGLGFLSLCTSGFAPTRHFGLLCAAALAAALVGDLVILPATLRFVGRPRPSPPTV